MDIEAARGEFARAVAAGSHDVRRFQTARAVLVACGIDALGLAASPGLTVADVVRAALDTPASDGRRAFAVLLVHALGVPRLLPTRGPCADDVLTFLERALLNPLRRAGYLFDATAYDKRQALARLGSTIDEHMRPLEPTMPRWLQGLARD